VKQREELLPHGDVPECDLAMRAARNQGTSVIGKSQAVGDAGGFEPNDVGSRLREPAPALNPPVAPPRKDPIAGNIESNRPDRLGMVMGGGSDQSTRGNVVDQQIRTVEVLPMIRGVADNEAFPRFVFGLPIRPVR
jgi:hypothetical protein